MLEAVDVFVIDEAGEVLWQGKVSGDSEAVSTSLHRWRDDLVRVGLEAGPTSEWIGGWMADRGGAWNPDSWSTCSRR